jgi:6-phosphogluconate dehydrogenase
MNIGLVGLGSMGLNLAKNIISKKYKLYAYEKNEKKIHNLKNNNIQNLFLNESLEDMLSKIPSPRMIMLSLPADKIDECINELIDHLNPQDIIADLGNSLYLKSIERYDLLKKNNISFLGIGISGGPRGAKNGPAVMAGGCEHAWSNVKHVFEDIAAKYDNQKACCFFGSPGSGHFVKLVHNGIEYALMEGLAEISIILRQVYGMNNEDQSNIFNSILQTDTSSFLLKITSEIIKAKKDENKYFVDEVDNEIEQNGTGIWTIKAALDLGVSIPSIYEAVSTRSNSKNFNYKSLNIENNKNDYIQKKEIKKNELEEIIFFNFVCSLFQGLNLIDKSNKWDFFNFKIEDVFQAWSAGCILQGEYLNFINKKFKINKNLNLDFLLNLIEERCSKDLNFLRTFISNAIKVKTPCPVLSSNISYYDLIFTKHKIGETIQLQRSFFGLHPLKNKNKDKIINPYWTKL